MGGSTARVRWADDDGLVSEVRAGNEEAFARMYERHRTELLAYSRNMVGSSDDAEDVIQQTFLKAYRALRRSESRIAVRPWLYAIARNECVSLLRKRRESPTDPDASASSGSGVAGEVEDREEMRSMLADLSRLPDEQRQALLLSGVDSLSGDEIAAILGTDRERVKALVFRARRSLTQSREARTVSCESIREQLDVLRGGSLRRKVLREHLLGCEACRGYRERVRGERAETAAAPATEDRGELVAV